MNDMTPLARPPRERKPDWIRVKAPTSVGFAETKALMRRLGLATVCEEAACPNIGECWTKKHATVMILGDTCTRACAFCNVKTGMPRAVDPLEPMHTATAAAELGLEHIVITSVDRDDLPDGGASQFVKVIEALRRTTPATTIEILTPDFRNKAQAGLGEERMEVHQVMDDMRSADIDFLTMGQYLQPTPRHARVMEFTAPKAFDAYAAIARAKGFLLVAASPLTRSSYHAGADFAKLKAARATKLGRMTITATP